MPLYRKRPYGPPPPLAGGGNQSPAQQAIDWGRGRTAVSRQLRLHSSEAEQKLWRYLRRRQVNGLRFRRQFALGPYFADFVCLPARLVIEVDGGQHGLPTQADHDTRRTAWLNRNGFRVIRFWADEVMGNIAGVMDGIEAALRLPLPQSIAAVRDALPPPARGGGT